MPIELDEVQRKIRQLEIEREALKKETDEISRKRVLELKDKIATISFRCELVLLFFPFGERKE